MSVALYTRRVGKPKREATSNASTTPLSAGELSDAPRTMFLIDGLGGVTTALMLCLLLPRFHEEIGLTRSTLVMLGLFGVVYGAYSLACWRLVRTRWRRALAILIGANTFYCLVSGLVVVTHRRAMTVLGVSYFLVEIAVISALIGIELAVLRALRKGSSLPVDGCARKLHH